MVAGSVESGIARARVVAVVAALAGGREQVGSGYLVGGRLVLTAAHCTRDKATGAAAIGLRMIRASDGAAAVVVDAAADVVTAPDLDIAVVRLADAPWEPDLSAPVFARVDRTRSGVLRDCAAIGYPLFQRDPAGRARHTAELHGTIYQTDEAETGRLLLREPQLTSVGPGIPAVDGIESAGSVWGGLSGALVFHAGRAVGVIVEHHPRQGSAAVQLIAFDSVRRRAETDQAVRRVAETLGLPAADRLAWAAAEPVAPLAGLVDLLDPASGDLPRVGDLDPYRLRTTPSDYGDQDSYGAHDPYVPRTAHDVDIRLRAGMEPGRMVLVVGPSKSGKTRSAFEAARARWDQARLAAPVPGSLARLAAHPWLQTSGNPLVVWLDELDRFIGSAEPPTPAILTALCARPGPTVVVATLRREARDRLRAAGDLTRDTRAVLDTASTIEVASTVEDPTEQAAARAAYPDQPLEGAGLAERLGYAPELLQAYRDAGPVLQAVIHVAIDWARTGLSRPLPEPDLLEISGELLWADHSELDATPEEITAAIRQARTPLPESKNAAVLLTVPLPGRIRGYRAYDYLTAADDGQTGRTRPIPDQAWDDALHHADPDDAVTIGVAAYTRDTLHVAVRASEQAAIAGHATAAFNLGVMLAEREPPDLPAARRWFEQAATAGDTDAAYNLGVLLTTRWEPPDLPAARHWYEEAATPHWYYKQDGTGDLYQPAAIASQTDAAFNLGVLLAEREPPDLPAARDWYEQAAAAGHTGAAYNVGVLLADRWEPADLPAARDWYEQAAAAGHIDAAYNLGVLLATRWEPADLPAARGWFEQAAAAGHTGAANNLGVLLADRWEPADLPAARGWYEQAATAGDTRAANNLGLLLAEQWEPPDLLAARRWFEQAATAGHTGAAYNVGLLLATKWEPPDLPAARHWYEQAATAGDTGAMNNLGFLVAERSEPPDLPAARHWYEQAATAGHTTAAFNLGFLLAERWEPPDLPAARHWWEQAATAGHPGAAFGLGFLLADRWEPPDLPAARHWWEQAATAGHPGAAFGLGFLLADRWEPPDLPAARRWYEQAATAGDTDAAFNLGVLLVERWEPPDLPAARRWLEQAAAAGHTDAADKLGILLRLRQPFTENDRLP